MTIEKETTILDFDFGFTAVDADELEVVQKTKHVQKRRKMMLDDDDDDDDDE